MSMRTLIAGVALLAGLASFGGCSGGGAGNSSSPTFAVAPAVTAAPATASSHASASPTATPTAASTSHPTATPTPHATPTATPSASPSPTPTPIASVQGLAVRSGFTVGLLASIKSPRELAFLPNGDLLVGTYGTTIAIVTQADGAGGAGSVTTFYTAAEGYAAGVAYGPDGNIYFGTQHGIWRLPYHLGDRSEPAGSAVKLAAVRLSSAREDHVTTSVVTSATTLYASVGSSSNSTWPEIDATRATIQQLPLGSTAMSARAVQLRNGIGLAIDPASGHLWVAGAGQDSLTYGHPYEYADDVDAHPGLANYGWPFCEENHVAYTAGADCSQQAVPLIEFPAYATHIGLVFYPRNASGRYAFGSQYRGGLFVTSHGSWHCCPSTLPNVAFVAMNGDTPVTAVNWSDPTVQWTPFVYAPSDATNVARYFWRPTGVVVGPQGSLFVADDGRSAVYRIRPQ